MLIRSETPQDYEVIREINIAAFAVHPYSKQTEHLIVEELRAAGALAVSLVSEIDEAVVGHIAFSLAKINGQECQWYMVGPVAVLPNYQKQGIGKALVNAGLEAMRDLGAEGCVLVGDPGFYSRFGFIHSEALTMEGIPPEYLLCLSMGKGIPQGEVTHHPAFLAGLKKD
jgi:putative acetyltransferase